MHVSLEITLTGNGQGTGQDSPATVPRLSGILVPEFRDFLSGGILVAGLSRRFLSRSRLSRGLESRSRSKHGEFAGRDRDPVIVPGQSPIPGRNGIVAIFCPGPALPADVPGTNKASGQIKYIIFNLFVIYKFNYIKIKNEA